MYSAVVLRPTAHTRSGERARSSLSECRQRTRRRDSGRGWQDQWLGAQVVRCHAALRGVAWWIVTKPSHGARCDSRGPEGRGRQARRPKGLKAFPTVKRPKT